ncbi:hypothetical protein TrST_g6750 [Triparma strigata]|uniref:GP-PDE domain-containing protein n=1 Tax=Triparma strigata TaxID=1606541 RepID=A0A9W7C2P3_9STRA|nr:hypothetical protein TrST_g6750 [Triparma strigata]
MASFSATSLPIINAHRGAVYHGVENTMYAFEKGIEQGATSLELDVVRLSTGELVIFHGSGSHQQPGDVSDLCGSIQLEESNDSCSSSSSSSSESSFSTSASTLEADPETESETVPSREYSQIFPNVYYIEEMSLAQTQLLQFTSFSPGFAPILGSNSASPDFEEQIKKAKIPLLSEVLELCKRTGTHIALEMKGSGVEHDCLRMVEMSGMEHLVTFSSFHNERTALIRKMRSDMTRITTGKIFGEVLSEDWIEQTVNSGCNEAHICFADSTPENIAKAHAAGLFVMAWFPHPVNRSIWSNHTEDAACYEKVARSGVDMMCVNKPDLLKQVIDKISL